MRFDLIEKMYGDTEWGYVVGLKSGAIFYCDGADRSESAADSVLLTGARIVHPVSPVVFGETFQRAIEVDVESVEWIAEQNS